MSPTVSLSSPCSWTLHASSAFLEFCLSTLAQGADTSRPVLLKPLTRELGLIGHSKDLPAACSAGPGSPTLPAQPFRDGPAPQQAGFLNLLSSQHLLFLSHSHRLQPRRFPGISPACSGCVLSRAFRLMQPHEQRADHAQTFSNIEDEYSPFG